MEDWIVSDRSGRRILDLSAVFTTPEILELEEAWGGGVGDFGYPEAAEAMIQQPEYLYYIDDIHRGVRLFLGEKFRVYRALTPDALEWWESGGDLGPMSVTLREDLAHAWQYLAHFQVHNIPIIVVSFEISPDQIIMRGRDVEGELVIDGDTVSFHRVRIEEEE